MITATTRLVDLLGHPVSGSLSPRMQNAGLAARARLALSGLSPACFQILPSASSPSFCHVSAPSAARVET
jgi:hypothetical protein